MGTAEARGKTINIVYPTQIRTDHSAERADVITQIPRLEGRDCSSFFGGGSVQPATTEGQSLLDTRRIIRCIKPVPTPLVVVTVGVLVDRIITGISSGGVSGHVIVLGSIDQPNPRSLVKTRQIPYELIAIPVLQKGKAVGSVPTGAVEHKRVAGAVDIEARAFISTRVGPVSVGTIPEEMIVIPINIEATEFVRVRDIPDVLVLFPAHAGSGIDIERIAAIALSPIIDKPVSIPPVIIETIIVIVRAGVAEEMILIGIDLESITFVIRTGVPDKRVPITRNQHVEAFLPILSGGNIQHEMPTDPSDDDAFLATGHRPIQENRVAPIKEDPIFRRRVATRHRKATQIQPSLARYRQRGSRIARQISSEGGVLCDGVTTHHLGLRQGRSPHHKNKCDASHDDSHYALEKNAYHKHLLCIKVVGCNSQFKALSDRAWGWIE